MKLKFYKIFVAIYGTIFVAVLLASIFSLDSVRARNYPKLANIYLKSPITRSDAEELAKWDVVILHMLAQKNSADQIRYMRKLNPKIIILSYIQSQEFPMSKINEWDLNKTDGMLHKLSRLISDRMWLRDGAGNHVTFWKDFWMLNVSNYPADGARWTDVLSDYVANDIMSSGLWDGVFYDNVWERVSWVNKGQIDINNDGLVDSKEVIDRAWSDGMSALFKSTRSKVKKDIIIVGNGDKGFYGDLNGLYVENFTHFSVASWKERMRSFEVSKSYVKPIIAIIASAPVDGKSKNNYKAMRFGLTSALLQDGYFAFDAGSESHAEKWWYDEYDINLGRPSGDPASLNNNSKFDDDVWKREYEQGIAIVNVTKESQEIDLGGEYEKISGKQDPRVNDGAIVSQVTLGARDGLIMFKTFQNLKNSVFSNGDFIRFFDMRGGRARNGFFDYESNYLADTKIYAGDLDSMEGDEKIVLSGNRMNILNSRGDIWYRDFPFG